MCVSKSMRILVHLTLPHYFSTFSFPEISSRIVSQMWCSCRQQGVSMGHILGAWEVSLKYDVITTDLEDGYLDTFVDTFIPLRFTFLFYFLRPDKLAWIKSFPVNPHGTHWWEYREFFLFILSSDYFIKEISDNKLELRNYYLNYVKNYFFLLHKYFSCEN